MNTMTNRTRNLILMGYSEDACARMVMVMVDHGHDCHDYGRGLVETLQSGGAHLFPLNIFVCIYDGLQVTFFGIASTFVKVTEEVALHLLGWSRMSS